MNDLLKRPDDTGDAPFQAEPLFAPAESVQRRCAQTADNIE